MDLRRDGFPGRLSSRRAKFVSRLRERDARQVGARTATSGTMNRDARKLCVKAGLARVSNGV